MMIKPLVRTIYPDIEQVGLEVVNESGPLPGFLTIGITFGKIRDFTGLLFLCTDKVNMKLKSSLFSMVVMYLLFVWHLYL